MNYLDNFISIKKFIINGKNVIIFGENHYTEIENIPLFEEILNKLKNDNYVFIIEKEEERYKTISSNIEYVDYYSNKNNVKIKYIDTRDQDITLLFYPHINKNIKYNIISQIIDDITFHFNEFKKLYDKNSYLNNYIDFYNEEILKLMYVDYRDLDDESFNLYCEKLFIIYARYMDIYIIDLILNSEEKNICIFVGQKHADNLFDIFKNYFVSSSYDFTELINRTEYRPVKRPRLRNFGKTRKSAKKSKNQQRRSIKPAKVERL